MKGLLKGFAALFTGLVLFGGVASAAITSCTINNTGPGSVNTCVDSTNNTTTFFCTNNVNLNSSNVQAGASGTATVTGNGSGGLATSGNVSNSTITNVVAQLGCGQVAAVTPTPTTPATPVAPTTPATPAKPATPATKAYSNAAALPDTGSNNAIVVASIAAAVLVGGVILSQVGLSAFRRSAVK